MIEDYHVPDTKCVNCGKAMDGAAPVTGGRAPEPGDVGICLDCRHIQIYGEGMQFRELTDEEVVELAGDPEILLAMKVLGGYDKWRKRRRAKKE